MTGANIAARLEKHLDAARAALRHLSGDDDEAIAEACDQIDAAVSRIDEALPMATLGNLRLHAKALKAWHAGFYGDAPDSLERLLTALERVPPRLWDEKIGPA